MLLLVSGRTIVLLPDTEGPDAASSEWEDHSLDPVHGGT